MIEIRFTPADLARVRFARSPLEELVNSLIVLLGAPQRQAMHRPWIASVRPRIAGLDLDLAFALVRGPRYLPDFLAPPPVRMETVFDQELEQVRATPADLVRVALDEIREDRPHAPALLPLYENPERELGRVVDQLRAYWHAAVEPVWPRLRAVLDADLSYRAGELINGGAERLFANLHPELTYADEWLRIAKPGHKGELKVLSGAGVLLVPSVFVWPGLQVLTNEPYQPALTYAPRGIGQVWDSTADLRAAPIGELVGRSRAVLLGHLDLPVSTTQLAATLGMTPAAVSQHLSVLRRCHLVSSRRDGRTVLYQRTPLATQLLTVPG